MVENKGIPITSPPAQFMYFQPKSKDVIHLNDLALRFRIFTVAHSQIDSILNSSTLFTLVLQGPTCAAHQGGMVESNQMILFVHAHGCQAQ